MAIIDILEAKKQLSKLIARVVDGEEVIISNNGEPVARLVPYKESLPPKRKLGGWKGKVKILPGFYESDAEIVKLFNGDD